MYVKRPRVERLVVEVNFRKKCGELICVEVQGWPCIAWRKSSGTQWSVIWGVDGGCEKSHGVVGDAERVHPRILDQLYISYCRRQWIGVILMRQ
jgi:hypothetical protein